MLKKLSFLIQALGSQYIKRKVIYLFLISSMLHSTNTYAVEATIAKEAATKGASTVVGQIFKESTKAIGVAGPYVGLVFKTYQIGEEIRQHNFPTEKERSHAIEVAENLIVRTAEKELQNCFMKNRSSTERNSSGRPIACQEIAEMLMMLGGKNEVNNMTAIYNEYRKSINN